MAGRSLGGAAFNGRAATWAWAFEVDRIGSVGSARIVGSEGVSCADVRAWGQLGLSDGPMVERAARRRGERLGCLSAPAHPPPAYRPGLPPRLAGRACAGRSRLRLWEVAQARFDRRRERDVRRSSARRLLPGAGCRGRLGSPQPRPARGSVGPHSRAIFFAWAAGAGLNGRTDERRAGARLGSWGPRRRSDPGSAPLRRRGVLSGLQGVEWQIRRVAVLGVCAAGDSSAGHGCEVVNGCTAATVGGAGIGRWRAGLSGSAARRAGLRSCRVEVRGGAGAGLGVGMRRRWRASTGAGSVRSAAGRTGEGGARRKPAGRCAGWRARSGCGRRGASGGALRRRRPGRPRQRRPARPGPGRATVAVLSPIHAGTDGRWGAGPLAGERVSVQCAAASAVERSMAAAGRFR